MDGENWLSGGEGVHKAQGILFPQPGIEPVPPAVEAQSLNHWTDYQGSPLSMLLHLFMLLVWKPRFIVKVIQHQ